MKEWFRLHGSYEALKYTSSVDVFNELTGGTTDTVLISPDDFCIRQLNKALKMTTIVTATSVIGLYFTESNFVVCKFYNRIQKN